MIESESFLKMDLKILNKGEELQKNEIIEKSNPLFVKQTLLF